MKAFTNARIIGKREKNNVKSIGIWRVAIIPEQKAEIRGGLEFYRYNNYVIGYIYKSYQVTFLEQRFCGERQKESLLKFEGPNCYPIIYIFWNIDLVASAYSRKRQIEF